MKYSQFNSIVFIDGKYALYNSFKQNVIFLDEALKDLLEAAKAEGIDNLSDIHPAFYDYLKEQHFLVHEDEDEIEKVKQIVKSVDENLTSFLLTINPSMNCNFKCWYCYETHVKNSSLDVKMIEKINKFIKVTAGKTNMKFFNLSFFGGEPLLYFKRDVKPIIDFFVDECRSRNIDFQVNFTTNGYLINQDFIDYFKAKNISCMLQITLDGYREQHDLVRFVSANRGSYEEIIANIRLLINNGFFVRLRVNYTDKNIGDTYKIAGDFSDLPKSVIENNMVFDFHRVWQNAQLDNTDVVVDENIDRIREEGYKVINKSPNNVRDSCYADKRNSAVINYNGDLFKCTARDFTNVKRNGYLGEEGELVWESDSLNKRMEVKFHNKPCLKCRIMPLCNGACSQLALEHLGGDDYCVYYGDEREKDKVVKSKIEEILNAVPA